METELKPTSRFLLQGAAALLALAAGCVKDARFEPRAGAPENMLAADADARAEAVRKDPLAYLRRVKDNCARLEQYTLTLTRVERRGFFRTLKGPERIACKFRRSPFSVYMKWLDPQVKYGESTYVQGRDGNKVRFRPRHGLFGLPPGVFAVELHTPVTWGEARHPMTSFGLERLMEQSLDGIDAGEEYILRYEGLAQLPESNRLVHHLYFEFPNWKHKAPIEDLYVDVETNLPVATYLRYKSGRLDAAYIYDDVNVDVSLTDDDFLLEVERDPGNSEATAAVEDS